MADPIDLCTLSFATGVLAAGNLTLTPSQSAILPGAITSASRAIVRFLGRPVALTTFDEIVTPEGGRQDRGEPATATLAYVPIASLARVATGRTGALAIANSDPVGNQLATVAFSLSGDTEFLDLIPDGLILTRVASGVAAVDTLSFATLTTVNDLASAIVAVGGGWTARVLAIGVATPDLGLFPVADLVGAREPRDALGGGMTLDLFTRPAGRYDLDRATGILRFPAPGGCDGWGWNGGSSSFDGTGGAFGLPQFRVTYQAGWAAIPEPLQFACVELVKATLERISTDSSLEAETAKDYSYTVRDDWLLLPDWTLQVLHFYKDWKV